MTNKKITFGVVGCGEHAIRGHIVPSLKAGFELVAVYDPNSDNAKKAAELSSTPVTCHSSYETLLADETVETVMIVSPDKEHPEQLLAAVKAGKHVMIDKPLAIDKPGMVIVCQALELAAQKNLVITSCHPRRFDFPYWYMKTEAIENDFGSLLEVRLDFSYHAPSELWKQVGRSLLLDHFPHEIDYVNFLLGHSPFKATRYADTPDYYYVSGVRTDGIVFTCLGTRRLAEHVYPEEIRLRFERGEVLLNGKTGKGYRHYHGSSTYAGIESARPTDYVVRFDLLAKNFADAIQGCAPNYLTGQDLLVNMGSSVALAIDGWYDSTK